MTGKHSKFQLNRLAAVFIEISNDPELLSLRDPLAIVTIRMQELLVKIDAEEAVMRQERVQEAYQDYKFHKSHRNEEKAQEAFYKLDREMEKAYDEYRAWDQLFKAIETRRKLSESETKRLKEMHKFITQEDAYKFIAQIQAALIEVLGDHPKLFKKLQYKFIKLTGDGDEDVLGGGGKEEIIISPSGMDTGEILDTGAEF